VCVCLLVVQAASLPAQQWQETIRENRMAEMGAVPPSRHSAQPVYPLNEPVYPPQAMPDTLLSLSEHAGVNMGAAMEQIPSFDPMLPGYIPTSTPFDNPSSSLSTPVSSIPSSPDCTVRPQTVVEIQRMRQSASKIAVMMQQEALIMNKRKTYVEQMTVYLNDRIRELNKVKGELGQETRWMELSSQRIYELEQKEKLVKLQDVQSCLNEQTTRSNADVAAVGRSLTDIAAQAAAVQASINTIQARMDAINNGGTGGATATAVPATPPE